MHSIALAVQLAAVIICFAAVLFIAFRKTSSYSNTILITFICGFIQNTGYLMELLSGSAEEAIFALRFEYLGGAFEICLITYFIFKYCGHEFKKPLWFAFIIESILVVVGVWTWQWNGMYYKGAVFISDCEIPHIVLSHGWLYYVYAATTVLELIACVFILLVSMLKTKQKNMLYNYYVLIAIVAMPLLGFIVAVLGIFSSFDATPLSVAISVGLFAVSIARDHVFDVADVVGGSIIENLDNAIIILNNDNGLEYYNKRAVEIIPALNSYKKGEIIREHEISHLFDNKRQHDVKIGKRLFDVSVNTVSSERNAEVGKAVILFDVTENNLQLARMAELMDEKDAAIKSKSVFLENVSHEIRTPINIIMGMNEILLRDFANEDTQEYHLNIKDSSKTLLNLVNDVLDFSKIESGSMEIIENKFDFKHYLTDFLDTCSFRCSEKKLDFEYDIDKNIPRYMCGDILRIKQIAVNIMSNAIGNTDSGRIKMTLNCKLRSDYEADLIYTVEDTGKGIKFDEKSSVFDGFTDMYDKTGSNSDGTELGLSISKSLVELMGGVINFNSEYGKGSVFSIALPVKIPPENNETIGEIADKDKRNVVFRAGFTAPDAKVLIVDDTLTNLLVIRELLKETKVIVKTAKSGQECIDLVTSEHFDLVFLDHKMPGMDGVETFSRMRHLEGNAGKVPVIMLTANVGPESREYYITRNFTDFLPKPVSGESIVGMLYKYLPETLIKKNEK